jgi:hypothetical protein
MRGECIVHGIDAKYIKDVIKISAVRENLGDLNLYGSISPMYLTKSVV